MLAPCCASIINDDSCLSTVSNNRSKWSVRQNTIHRETGDACVTESANVPKLNSESFSDKCTTGSDFVVSVYTDGLIEYERISSDSGTAERSVGVS